MAFSLGSLGLDMGDVLSTGAAIYGANKAAGSAEDIAASTIAASQPKTVIDPLGYAKYDKGTETYNLGMSPISQGMFTRGMQDVQRFRQQVAPYMRDPEAAARQRYRQNLATIQPGMDDATQQLMSKLNTRGMLGSTVGAGMAAKKSREDAIKRAQLMEQSRGSVQAELTNLLNRESAARQRATALAGAGQPLATTGSGIGANIGTVAGKVSPQLQSASSDLYGAYAGIVDKYLGTNKKG